MDRSIYAGAWEYVVVDPLSPQARGLVRSPINGYWPEPVTATVPTPIGWQGNYRAPFIPYNAPGGVSTAFSQLNGMDVPWTDPNIARYGAPNIPRVGGAGC